MSEKEDKEGKRKDVNQRVELECRYKIKPQDRKDSAGHSAAWAGYAGGIANGTADPHKVKK